MTSAASWCSLCFTDLHPAPLASATFVVPARDGADASPLPDADIAAEVADRERVADQLLAELAASSGTPGHGRFTLLSTTTGRVVATVVATLAATALGLGLLALGGALL